eukprot:1146041-Pelagomonas_calceolata.AAC.22
MEHVETRCSGPCIWTASFLEGRVCRGEQRHPAKPVHLLLKFLCVQRRDAGRVSRFWKAGPLVTTRGWEHARPHKHTRYAPILSTPWPPTTAPKHTCQYARTSHLATFCCLTLGAARGCGALTAPCENQDAPLHSPRFHCRPKGLAGWVTRTAYLLRQCLCCPSFLAHLNHRVPLSYLCRWAHKRCLRRAACLLTKSEAVLIKHRAGPEECSDLRALEPRAEFLQSSCCHEACSEDPCTLGHAEHRFLASWLGECSGDPCTLSHAEQIPCTLGHAEHRCLASWLRECSEESCMRHRIVSRDCCHAAGRPFLSQSSFHRIAFLNCGKAAGGSLPVPHLPFISHRRWRESGGLRGSLRL